MTVRTAEQKDARRISELLRDIAKLHSDGRPDIFKPTLKHDEADIRRMIGDPDTLLFVAADDSDGVQGYVICNLRETSDHRLLRDGKVLWVDDLCVDESVRGKGYGKLLSAAVKEYAVRSGCVRVELNVWQFNARARDFYERFGMTPQRTVMEMKL